MTYDPKNLNRDQQQNQPGSRSNLNQEKPGQGTNQGQTQQKGPNKAPFDRDSQTKK
jgi:hypothetical protein